MLLGSGLALAIFAAGIATLLFRMKRSKASPLGDHREKGSESTLESVEVGGVLPRSWGRRSYDRPGVPKPPFAGRRRSDMVTTESSMAIEDEFEEGGGYAASSAPVDADNEAPIGSVLRVGAIAPSPEAQVDSGNDNGLSAEEDGNLASGVSISQNSDSVVLSEKFTQALVFLNMGERETALSMLEEFTKSGNPKEKLEAVKLLNELDENTV
jgi:hypothetical protein